MKRLLVALDASQRAMKVLETGSDLARRTGSKMFLLRVVGLPPEIPMSPFGVSPDGFLQVLIEDAKKQLDEQTKNVPPELVEGRETRVGTAWASICEAAKEHAVDLIVIGSHGYQGLDRVLGTTAAKVVNHAECSVLVARNLHI
ncbi:MAG: universal stress protein [Polyangiaceae bacterium]|nr:universal stress protein [Polyangiaceae bacterium]